MVLCCQLNPSDGVPYHESLTALLLIGMCFQAMASRAEVVSDGAMGGEKALGMTRGLEAAHDAFPLPSRLV